MAELRDPNQMTMPEGTKIMDQATYNQMMNDAKKNINRPDRPEFESLLGADGLIGKQYQVGGELNADYLNQMREDGLRKPGEQSQWRQLMEQKVQGQAGQAMANAQGQTANAMSNMAMKGGLSGGAAERMAGRGAQGALQAGQGVLGQRLGLDIQDEQMRQGQLQSLGNAEMGAATFNRQGNQFNIQNSLNDVLQNRASDINSYNEEMRAWAAERTAAATPSSGGGKK